MASAKRTAGKKGRKKRAKKRKGPGKGAPKPHASASNTFDRDEERAQTPADVVDSLNAAPDMTCDDYLKVLRTLATRPFSIEGAKVHAALTLVCSYFLFANDAPPLRARSPGMTREPSDLDPSICITLGEISEDVPIDLRARIHDVLWEAEHKQVSGEVAAQTYVAAAHAISHNGYSVEVASRIRRAIGILRMMKKDESDVVATALSMAQDPALSDSTRTCVASALHSRRTQGLEILAPIIEEIAKRQSPPQEGGYDWEWHRHTWEIAAAFHRAAGDASAEQRARLASARSYRDQSDWLRTRGAQASIRADLLQRGLLDLRQLDASEDEIWLLRQELVSSQKESASQMIHFAGDSIDFGEEARSSREFVSSLQWRDAMLRFAKMVRIPQIARLRDEARRTMEQHPLLFLVSRKTVDADGRTVAVETSEEDLVQRHMFDHATLERKCTVLAIIEPARRQILSEHRASEMDWALLLRDSPVLDRSRVECWIAGLDAGLRGNWMVAAHLVIPQLEHLIRSLLEMHGCSTTAFVDDRVERGNTFGKLLHHPELPNILGESIVFDLKGLFTDPGGSNLRNRVSHGQLNDAQFYAEEVVYAWHLALRFLLVPVLNKERTKEDPRNETTSGSEVDEDKA